MNAFLRSAWTIAAKDLRSEFRTKEALKMLGVIPDATVRLPLLPLADADRRVVQTALQRAGLLKG